MIVVTFETCYPETCTKSSDAKVAMKLVFITLCPFRHRCKMCYTEDHVKGYRNKNQKNTLVINGLVIQLCN